MFIKTTGVCLLSLVLASCFESQVVHGAKGAAMKCPPIEMGIVLDSSSSIDDNEFAKAKEFLLNFLRMFHIGPGKSDVRVSLITFGRGIYTQDAFSLIANKKKVLRNIMRLRHREGNHTDTGLAIKYMHEKQLKTALTRQNAVRLSIVLTDGRSQNWPFTKRAAAAARADGIIMFAIGVGSGTGNKELLRIAGEQKRVIKVDNFNKLVDITDDLRDKACFEVPTPPPKEQECGEKKPSDISFVFSPASLGLDATAWVTSFISITTDSSVMKKGFQFGVLAGSCPIDEGFKLGYYKNDKDRIKKHLHRFDKNKISDLLKTTREETFKKSNGGRAGAKKVVVVFINGKQYGRGKDKGNEIKNGIEELKAQGVEVYVANPAGFKLKIDGAVALSGRSSRLQAEMFVNILCR